MIVEENLEKISEKVVSFLSADIVRKLTSNKACLIGLSGGNTPKGAYELLSEKIELFGKYSDSIKFVQIDERWVDANNRRSNQYMINKVLFSDSDYSKHFLPMPTPDICDSIDEAVISYHHQLENILQVYAKNSMDIAILGMGDDGHTASLFPFNKQYQISLTTKLHVMSAEVKSQQELRLSLTPHFLNTTKKLYLIITGKEKGITLKQAINSKDHFQFPISLFINDKLTIFMDKECEQGFQS